MELSFAFKDRWSKTFGQEIDVTLVSSSDDVLAGECQAVRDEVRRKVTEKNIKLVTDGKIAKITATDVHLVDGRVLECSVPIWATGAEP